MAHVGEKIKSLRTEKNMSRSKLSEISGISEISIRKIEDGSRNPKVETLDKVANALNVSVDYFIDEEYIKKQELLSSFRNFLEQNTDIENDIKLLGNLLGEYINSSFLAKLISLNFDNLNNHNIKPTKLNGFTEDEFLSLIKVLNTELLKIISNRKANPLSNQKFLVTFDYKDN
ncbi:helix-turn-helix transcriptional regulator [Clostridium sp.]|uniref:helix-turn-helix domain-containing protein n=1 Tax=Clostridium sp. TaxID=1506 RepID=UPI00284875BF|nr:helix-turn-helix transcriptional regulator [Clostridium sp.]MDR3594933.1 helix-turn-helix transcriptional regulator [Clostridium sp.]